MDEPWSLDPRDPFVLDVAHAADTLRTAAAVVGAANDARALAGPDVVDGFEVTAAHDLRVGVMAETLVPPWVRRRLVRPAGPLVTFSVGWQPADVVRLEAERPPHAFQVQRERVRPLVRATARLIATETAGIVIDADGFDVADYELWG